MEIFKLLLAFIIFVGIVYAVYKIVIFTQRNLKLLTHRVGPQTILYLALDVLSIIVGVWFVLLTWKWTETLKFMGFLIPAAVWQYSNGVCSISSVQSRCFYGDWISLSASGLCIYLFR